MEPTSQGEAAKEVQKLSQVIQIDEGKIQEHLGEVVRSTVEETLNAMLASELKIHNCSEHNHFTFHAGFRLSFDLSALGVACRYRR
jgi:hypothetical protein